MPHCGNFVTLKGCIAMITAALKGERLNEGICATACNAVACPPSSGQRSGQREARHELATLALVEIEEGLARESKSGGKGWSTGAWQRGVKRGVGLHE
eukprot:2484799-Amphidinium_carterae.1